MGRKWINPQEWCWQVKRRSFYRTGYPSKTYRFDRLFLHHKTKRNICCRTNAAKQAKYTTTLFFFWIKTTTNLEKLLVPVVTLLFCVTPTQYEAGKKGQRGVTNCKKNLPSSGRTSREIGKVNKTHAHTRWERDKVLIFVSVALEKSWRRRQSWKKQFQCRVHPWTTALFFLFSPIVDVNYFSHPWKREGKKKQHDI